MLYIYILCTVHFIAWQYISYILQVEVYSSYVGAMLF